MITGDLKSQIDSKEIIVVGADVDTNDWSRLTPKNLILFNTTRNLKNGLK